MPVEPRRVEVPGEASRRKTPREKLLMLVTLCYAFLLSLLVEELTTLRLWLLRHFCHRTGKRQRDRAASAAPPYRLRSALSRLWLAHPEQHLPILSQSSG